MFSRLNVRTKLLVMLMPAAVGLCGLAGLGVKTRLDDRTSAQITRDVSTVAAGASTFVHQLQQERLVAATAAAAPSTELTASLVTQRADTDAAARDLRGALAATADVLDGPASAETRTLVHAIDQLTATRAAATTPAAGIEAYTTLIGAQLSAIGRLELTGGDAAATTTNRRWLAAGIEAESAAGAAASQLLAPGLSDADRGVAARSAQQLVERSRLFYDNYTQYVGEADAADFRNGRAGFATAASNDAFDVLAAGEAATGFDAAPDEWSGLVQRRVRAVEIVERASYSADVARFSTAATEADDAAIYFASGAAASCLLVLLLAFGISRNITATLRRLTDAAREISEEQVPALVHGLRSGNGLIGTRFTEVDTNSRDEFADVGNALNELGRAMVAVATEQQQSLRKGISDIFVNLARRNQTLLDRQIQFIDRLEANEEDPDQLENLFALDHLATRMRRNAESLLVLAGAEAPRRRARDVELADVIRVAVGEVEDFARISLMAVEDAEAIGSAAVDVAHLLAELMENGAQYSPPERTVDVVGHRASDGGYVISITDHGVGMTAERLDAANRLLASPPPVGLALSRALGFVVAGTLAARHGIVVHLVASPSGGVTAEVTLPPTVLRAPIDETVATPTAPVAEPAPEIVEEIPGFSGFVPLAGPDLDAEPMPEPSGAPVSLAPPAPVAGWTVDGEYVEPFDAPSAPVEPAFAEPAHLEPLWSAELLPDAPAPSKLIDMLPEGSAFDEGLYSLLGTTPPAPTADALGVEALPAVHTTPLPELDPGTPPPFAPENLWSTPATPGPATPGPATPGAGRPAIPGLWAPPIVHPRPNSGESTGSTIGAATPTASPAPMPTPPSAPPLPQRTPRSATPAAEPEIRTAAPQRAAEDVRSVLSRYRSGLDHGRSGGAGSAGPNDNSQYSQNDEGGVNPR